MRNGIRRDLSSLHGWGGRSYNLAKSKLDPVALGHSQRGHGSYVREGVGRPRNSRGRDPKERGIKPMERRGKGRGGRVGKDGVLQLGGDAKGGAGVAV